MLALRFSIRQLEGEFDPGLEEMSLGLELDLEPADTGSGVGSGWEAKGLSTIVSSLLKAVRLSRLEASWSIGANGGNALSQGL